MSNYHSADAFLDRPDGMIAFEAFCGLVPQWAVTLLHQVPTRRIQRLRNYMKEARQVAQALLDRQVVSHAEGKEGSKDVMSILSTFCFPTLLRAQTECNIFDSQSEPLRESRIET